MNRLIDGQRGQMNIIEHRRAFRAHLERLAASIDRKLTDEQAEAYWIALKRFSLEDIKNAVDRLIGTIEERSFPTVAVMVDEVIRSKAQREHWIPVYCKRCNNTGIITTRRDDVEFGYRCSCPNGQRLDRRIPRMRPELESMLDAPSTAPPHLPLVTRQVVEEGGLQDVYPHGCNITRVCVGCGQPFTSTINRAVTKAEVEYRIWKFNLCEQCYEKKGREQGLWR